MQKWALAQEMQAGNLCLASVHNKKLSRPFIRKEITQYGLFWQ